MWHIVKSELDRFWKAGLAAAVTHLIFWQVVLSKEPLSTLGGRAAQVALAIAAVTAAAFGLYQIGSLKKPGTWAFLIHRPMAPWKVFAALVGAGCIWLAGVVALPTGLSVLHADAFTRDLVDGRHYGLPFMLLGATWFFYAVALLTRLSPSRSAVLAVALMPFFATDRATGWWAGAALIVMLAIVLALAAAHFKADLERPSRSRIARAGLTAVVTYGFAVTLLWLTLVGYSLGVAFKEHGITGPAKHSWNDYFPADSIDGASYRNAQELLEAGFARLETESAQALVPQIALAETATLIPWTSRFPRRHEPMYNHEPATLWDGTEQVRWTFSHREMLFRGVQKQTEDEVGWLGPEGFMDAADEPRFTSVPMTSAPSFGLKSGFFFTPDALMQVDFVTRRVTERFRMPYGEMPSFGPVKLGSTQLLLTDRALYAFDGRGWAQRFAASEPVARVELPARIGRLHSIQAAELLDGLLLSMIFDDAAGQGDAEAFQWLAEVSLDGEVQAVGNLPLSQAVPDEIRFRGATQSPIHFVFDNLMSGAITSRPDHWRQGDGFGFHLTARAWRWMVICSVTAAILAWITASRRRLDGKTRLGWVLWCLISGPAGWLAMLFLTERPPVPIAPVPQMLGRVPALSAVTSSWNASGGILGRQKP